MRGGSKKGERRGGRKKGTPNAVKSDQRERLSQLARVYTQEALDRLVKLMRSKDENVAIRAVDIMLDRGWGRAAQTLDIGNKEDKPFRTINSEMSPAEAAQAYAEMIKND
jgi:hypothetical protein